MLRHTGPTTMSTIKDDAEEGTAIAKGKHVVPDGVAVEELDGGKKKLSKECPQALRDMLNRKELTIVYDDLVKTIVEESKTRDVFGKWRDTEFVSILDTYADDFARGNVKVALCKRRSGGGTFRWLEFIDRDVVPDYVPQYDVSNLSGQVINTCYTKIEFPNGVVVEELKRFGNARKKLQEKMPVYVEEMMTKKGLLDEYNALVADCIASKGTMCKKWDTDKISAIVKAHAPKFESKKVVIFVGYKEEYISHGQYGGHMEFFHWFEFVDREVQPNYYPQRDADTRKQGCVVS